MNHTPHAKMLMMPNNMLEAKHINHGYRTSCICCAWVWNSSHLDLVYLFTQSKAFFSFHFYFACGLFNIHKSVVLSPMTFGTSKWMLKSTQLHLKAMCLVQMFMKQPFGHIKTRACIHLATPSWAFMNPFNLFHRISMFVLHKKRNLLKCKIWVWNWVYKKIWQNFLVGLT
jgi:hypothetical protein